MPATRTSSSDRAYEIMLKRGRAKKTAGAASGSALAASRAIDNIATVTKRIKQGDEVNEAYLAALSAVANPQAPVAGEARRKASPLGKFGGVGIAAAVVVGAVAASLTLFSTGTHSVSGTLLLDRQALPGVAIVFHSVSAEGTAVRVVTSAKGEFTVPDLPEGKYKVAVEADDSSPRIPEAYRSPKSTPFSLQVQKDLANLRLFAVGGRRG